MKIKLVSFKDLTRLISWCGSKIVNFPRDNIKKHQNFLVCVELRGWWEEYEE